MNKRTAAILLIEDLLVLNCTFDGNTKPYTYVSRKAWLPGLLEPADVLVVQGRSTPHKSNLDRPRIPRNKLDLVDFVSYGDLEDLDLDNNEITYRFALGVLGFEVTRKYAEAEESIDNVLRTLQRQRIEAMRADVRQRLLGVDVPL